ncbi:TetR/AcrR family transcriptional regulator [Erysipelothrix tonsillarum]|uniref:TetR/AcrR family transcriptional regulator n=1 Tax=Erysipelothrix tonsillarum TaxID=38402 RepID=UPI00037E7887|nr:TetR/AcrR family transcriptional regulator [Erysipelothrix tonsillarum]
MTSTHKDLKKQRTMLYFMHAAKEIVNTEGIQAITIRKVADIAGYNSATLYNYFDNLEQLIAFSMIHTITDYLHYLDYIVDMKLNELDKYLLMWRCYSECSFQEPEIYAYVFDSAKSDEILAQIDVYNRIFPINEKTQPSHINDLVIGQDMNRRNQLSIGPCVDAGYFKEENVSYIVNFAYIMHQGITRRLIKGYYTDGVNHAKEFLTYFVEFLENYVQEDLIDRNTVSKILSYNYKDEKHQG